MNEEITIENSTIEKTIEENIEEGILPENFDLDSALEAILFAAGHPMTYEQLGKPFNLEVSSVKKRIEEYAAKYNNPEINRGVILLTFDDSCQLCTKKDFLPYIRIALGIRKSGSLSSSCIESLAIIAYNQPVTRAYVDAVRGVDSSYAVTTLLERGLIEITGRLDAPGRPFLFGTTSGFLRSFGLSSLSELPNITSKDGTPTLTFLANKLDNSLEEDERQFTMMEQIDDSMENNETLNETLSPMDAEESQKETILESEQN